MLTLLSNVYLNVRVSLTDIIFIKVEDRKPNHTKKK